MQFPLLTSDWSADEEMLMLEGLESLGWGNWEDVSEHITTKEKDEVREHYAKIYLESPYWPSADLSRLFSVREDVKRYNYDPSLLDRLSPRNRGVNRTNRKINFKKPLPSRPVRTDLSNFMPLRGEFEVEWDNDAENSVKDLIFENDETSEELEAKIRLLEIYNDRLEERYEKRNFVVERNLHDTKLNREKDKKRGRDDKGITIKFKKFMELLTNEEYEKFVNGILEEATLKQRIKELQECRLNGVRSINEIETFKSERTQMHEPPKRGRPLGSGKKQSKLRDN